MFEPRPDLGERPFRAIRLTMRVKLPDMRKANSRNVTIQAPVGIQT
jgi:hypothetical protein